MLAELQWNLTDRNLSKTQRERPENTHPSPTPRRVGHPKNLRLVRNSMGGPPALLKKSLFLKIGRNWKLENV
jgi:hypothetical protein